MKSICNNIECLGCGVCAAVCGFGAVRLREDMNGFLSPKIDMKKCRDCGACYKHCPLNTDLAAGRSFQADYYGGCAKNIEEVKSSTSGGLASVLARTVIRSGGVVFGAAFDPFPVVRHISVEAESEVVRLKGSKYVESDISDALRQIKPILAAHRKVLFIGLPCHVAAIRSFLGGDDKNLITVDMVCHGKPPQKLFSHWVGHLEERRQSKILDYRFRVKTDCKWNDPRTNLHSCRFSDGRMERISHDENWYSRYFLGSASFRECCYHCRFAKLPRVGDITLADFWGVEKDKRFKGMIESGVSLISVNSGKGRTLVQQAESNLELFRVSNGFALKANGGLAHSSTRPIYRNFVYLFVYANGGIVGFCDRLVWFASRFARKIIGARKAQV